MLKWPDVLRLAKEGNPAPDHKVIRTEAEWHEQLSPEQYRVTRQAGTERAFSSEMWQPVRTGNLFLPLLRHRSLRWVREI